MKQYVYMLRKVFCANIATHGPWTDMTIGFYIFAGQITQAISIQANLDNNQSHHRSQLATTTTTMPKELSRHAEMG
jgi:hypothetical protein